MSKIYIVGEFYIPNNPTVFVLDHISSKQMRLVLNNTFICTKETANLMN